MEQKFPVPLLPEVVDGVFVVVAAAVVVAYKKYYHFNQNSLKLTKGGDKRFRSSCAAARAAAISSEAI